MSARRRERPARAGLVKNFAWVTFGHAAAKPLWFLFITALCTRVLGASEYGTMIASLALVGLLISFTELGTNDYATRELAHEPDGGSGLFTNLLVGRAALGALAVCLIPLARTFGYEGPELAAFAAAGAYTVAFRLGELCRTYYRAVEVLRYEAGSVVAERLLVIGGGTAGLLTTRTAWGTLVGMGVGVVLSLALNVAWIHTRLSALRLGALGVDALAKIYRAALPIGVMGLFILATNVGGIVLVEALLGNAEAGRYGAAYKVLEMLQLAPALVCAPLFPRFAALIRSGDTEAFYRLLYRTTLGLAALSVAVAGAVALLAPLVVEVLAPGEGFEGTVGVLRAILWAYPPMAVGMLLLYALIAADGTRIVAALAAVAAVVVAVATPFVAPRYGAEGVALVLAAAHAIIVLGTVVRLVRDRVASAG